MTRKGEGKLVSRLTLTFSLRRYCGEFGAYVRGTCICLQKIAPGFKGTFPRMSIRGNLELGAAYIPRAKGKIVERMEFVFDLFPIFKKRLNQPAGTLSGGEQPMLAIGRALMADPKFLILDEPSSELQPSLVSELYPKLEELKEEVSMLLAEHNVRQRLKAVDRGYIIENGKITLEVNAESLARNDHVRKSYLGL
jgi:branched-chain amino acid transport system ATP-binding protein